MPPIESELPPSTSAGAGQAGQGVGVVARDGEGGRAGIGRVHVESGVLEGGDITQRERAIPDPGGAGEGIRRGQREPARAGEGEVAGARDRAGQRDAGPGGEVDREGATGGEGGDRLAGRDRRIGRAAGDAGGVAGVANDHDPSRRCRLGRN